MNKFLIAAVIAASSSTFALAQAPPIETLANGPAGSSCYPGYVYYVGGHPFWAPGGCVYLPPLGAGSLTQGAPEIAPREAAGAAGPDDLVPRTSRNRRIGR